MRWLLILLAGLLVFIACDDDDGDPVEPTPCNQCVVSIPALADNTLYEDPTGSLSNGNGQNMFSGLNSEVPPKIRRAVVSFRVHAYVPLGATVDSVRVFVTTITGTVIPFRSRLHRLLADWGEGASDPSGTEEQGAQAAPGDATWINTFWPDSTWAGAGGDFAIVPSGSTDVAGAGARYTYHTTPQMVADVQSWLDDPANNFGWLIKGNENPGLPGSLKGFGTQQNPQTQSRPSLQVFYRTP